MNTKDANLELIKPKFGTSFELKHFVDGNQNEKATFWHFHPELELVYVKGGRGVRHVGHHMSHYKNGDLVLIGSNLPHSGFTDRNTGHESEVVIQFKKISSEVNSSKHHLLNQLRISFFNHWTAYPFMETRKKRLETEWSN
jgi:hypothetical protein